jgi:hypothetical protein
MGKVQKTYYDKLISEIPDRNANRVRVYRKDNGEVVIHFRNLKITLFTEMEIQEWKDGFTQALEELRAKDYFKNDL